MKEKGMKRVNGLPQMTRAAKKQLEALASLPDSDINTDDIPEWTEDDFTQAIRLNGRPLSEVMKLYRVRKSAVTARIDQDVLAWLKGKGEGYQTRMNAILRAAMLKDLRQRSKHTESRRQPERVPTKSRSRDT